MKRCLFITFACLSLLLCAATVAAWVRSYRVAENVSWRQGRGAAGFGASRGQLSFWRAVPDGPDLFVDSTYAAGGGAWQPFDPERLSRPGIEQYARWGGFGFWAGRSLGAQRQYLFVPCWAVALVTSLAPLRWWRSGRRRRRERRPRGMCPDCGYDLTGNESGVCPECGTRVSAMAKR